MYINLQSVKLTDAIIPPRFKKVFKKWNKVFINSFTKYEKVVKVHKIAFSMSLVNQMLSQVQKMFLFHSVDNNQTTISYSPTKWHIYKRGICVIWAVACTSVEKMKLNRSTRFHSCMHPQRLMTVHGPYAQAAYDCISYILPRLQQVFLVKASDH